LALGFCHANKPLEWTGHHEMSSALMVYGLPHKGSVSSTVPRAGGSRKLGLKSDPG